MIILKISVLLLSFKLYSETLKQIIPSIVLERSFQNIESHFNNLHLDTKDISKTFINRVHIKNLKDGNFLKERIKSIYQASIKDELKSNAKFTITIFEFKQGINLFSSSMKLKLLLNKLLGHPQILPSSEKLDSFHIGEDKFQIYSNGKDLTVFYPYKNLFIMLQGHFVGNEEFKKFLSYSDIFSSLNFENLTCQESLNSN
ncbi:MAG: hypothetical protein H6622_01735 [Halobacteriovoraceae bacterium]|nr:hypothetical protein [Halobacteriovoraceae bacterium]